MPTTPATTFCFDRAVSFARQQLAEALRQLDAGEFSMAAGAATQAAQHATVAYAAVIYGVAPESIVDDGPAIAEDADPSHVAHLVATGSVEPPEPPVVDFDGAADPNACPGCGGEISTPPGDLIGECMRCGGAISVGVVSYEEACKVVRLDLPMVDGAADRYFDLVTATGTIVRRTHGWTRRDGRVVQFG